MRLDEVVQTAERRAIHAALRKWKGNRTRAAVELGISVGSLYRKLRKERGCDSGK